MLFTNVQTADGERYWGLTGPQKARLIFLETAAGTMLIIADASDAAGFDALLSQATPIVESVKLPAH